MPAVERIFARLAKSVAFIAALSGCVCTCTEDLSAEPWPEIIQHPASQVGFEGEDIRLTVDGKADSFEGLRYAWLKDGVRLPGSNQQVLVIRTARLADAGIYSAVVRNPFGQAWSQEAYVDVICRLPDRGHPDPLFRGSIATGDGIRALAVDSAGRLVAVGDFVTYGPSRSANIVRLLPDGSVDPTFAAGTGTNDVIHAVSIAGDSIWIGGDFTQFNGRSCSHVVRLNSDGSIPPEYQTDRGPAGRVESILPDEDGAVLIGGSFNRVGGQPIQRLARLFSNGQLDPAFTPGFTGTVHDMVRDSAGRVVLVGSFVINGYNRLARILPNGQIDTGFFPGKGSTSPVRDVAIQRVQGEERIVVSGSFGNIHGQPQSTLARLLPNGEFDSTFDVDPIGGLVDDIAVDNAGAVIVGGSFKIINGKSCPRIARITEDGKLDQDYQPPQLNGNVRSLARAFDRGVFVAGDFDLPRRFIIKLQDDSNLPAELKFLCHPRGRTSAPGSKVRFSALAAGCDSVSYQWYHNPDPGNALRETAITGANAPFFEIYRVSAANEGSYHCRVECNKNGSRATSEPAVLRLRPLRPGEVPRHHFSGAQDVVANADASARSIPVIESLIEISEEMIIGDLDVAFSLDHGDTKDLSAELVFRQQGRASIALPLFANPEPTGSKFTRTTFNDESNRSFSAGLPPFTGSYRLATTNEQQQRELYKLDLFDGRSAIGKWYLRIFDSGQDDFFAKLVSWELIITEKSQVQEYANWAVEYFPAISPPPFSSEDTDGDGVANVVDFALARQSGERLPWSVRSDSSGLHFTHTRWISPVDIDYRYEVSADLSRWTEAIEGTDYELFQVTDYPSGYREVDLRVRPFPDISENYFRLVVK